MAPQLQHDRSPALDQRLELGPLPLPEAILVACDIAKALRHLHAAGQAHGAVAPRTILTADSPAHLLPTAFSLDSLRHIG